MACYCVERQETKVGHEITTEIRKKAKQCHEQWTEEKCWEVEYSAQINTQKLLRTVNELCGTFTPKLQTVKDSCGKVLEEKESIKERWKEYSEDLYNRHNSVDNTMLSELTTTNQQEIM